MSPPYFFRFSIKSYKTEREWIKDISISCDFLSKNASNLLKALLFVFQLKDRVSVKEIAL